MRFAFAPLALLAALPLAVAAPAQAATVFDQGPPSNNGGVRSSFWNADDFTLSAATLLTGATFYLVDDRLNPPSRNINYAIYADAAGTPGALLQTGTATATVTDLRLGGFSGISYFRLSSWAFDFSSAITTLANVRYWVGVQHDSDVPLANTLGTNPGALATISGGVAGPFSARDVGLAFSVQGSAITGTPGGVPEPATWAMLIMGFGLIGAAARRSPSRQLRIRYA